MWVPGETTVPGVFAAGDVRAAAMNRGGVGRRRGLDGGAIRSRIPGTDLNRFTLVRRILLT